MAGTEIIMLGALVLGAAVFIKVLPKLQADMQAAAAPGGAATTPAATSTTSCPTVNVGDAGCPSCTSTNGTNCVCTGNSGCSCTDTTQCAASTSTATTDPCAQFSNLQCVPYKGGCVRSGNSQCSCTGCTQTHSTSTANKPGGTAGTTGQQARAAAAAARGHVNPTRQPKPNSPGNSCVNHVCPLQ